MISGFHAIIYSENPDADRKFLRDVFRFPHVDVCDANTLAHIARNLDESGSVTDTGEVC
jgi:hypothetical protein